MKGEKFRNYRQAEKWIKRYRVQHRLHRQIKRNAADILNSPNFNRTKTFIQHGNMTVNSHCMDVAKYSLAISERLEKLGFRCKRMNWSEARSCMIIFYMTGIILVNRAGCTAFIIRASRFATQ